MYQDINGKTAFTNLLGTSGKTYNHVKLLNADERLAMLADGINEFVKPARPEPTPEQKEANAKVEAIKSAKAYRDLDLSELTHTFANGSVIQVRPQDQQYLSLAIQIGQPIDWVLEDDTVRLTSLQELTEALASGIQQGSLLWGAYTEGLKTGVWAARPVEEEI